MPRKTGGHIALFENRFEYSVEEELSEQVVTEIGECRTQDEKRFVFRCFIVPYFSVFVIKHLKKSFPIPPYYIHEPWSYVLSHSRIVREMTFQKVITLDHLSEGYARAKLSIAANSYVDWIKRFDLWRKAITESMWYYVRKKGVDTSYPDERIARAAIFGTIERLWGAIPATELGNMIGEMRQRSEREVRAFHSHAAEEKVNRWDHPQLDLWLMEIWPLALGYNWNYWDTWRVATKKFPSPSQVIPKPLASAEALSNHCKMLDLRLSEFAQEHGRGRPKANTTLELPPLAELALEIDGFQSPGDNETTEDIRIAVLEMSYNG